MLPVDSLYEIKNPIDLDIIYNNWYAVPEFRQNDDTSHKQESNAFKRYKEFRVHEQKMGLGIGQETNTIRTADEVTIEKESYLFALEEHLQDFLIRNLTTIKKHKLKLFEDGERRGKEYPTEVGPIDILTIDEKGDFYVFETKLSKGMDRALGQLLRYMGWVKINLAKDKNVYGIIVANKMDEKIKYAVEVTPNISLCEYEMKFDINFLDKM
ncbi:endonuclease NucS domain-containing protein [Aquiflexum sp.]|uniref:endonuclease NucS domain-containing protein n=1 Tax=Aquiflexum sp. TaxID=1872584 RepID=UPI00359362EB